jgi:hypothetical protein
MSRQPNSVQRDTYIRANYNKKKIKQPDFPAEAPESSCHKRETANAEHSLHDLSSKSSKECSPAEINESCDGAKNYGGTKQAEKHSAHEVFPKYCHSLVVLYTGSKPFAETAKFSLTVSKYLFATGLQLNGMTHLFEAFSVES